MKSLKELYKTYGKDISDAAIHYGLDEDVLAGLIWQESRGNPKAMSHCGAFGLTQIMPATAKDRGYKLDTPRQQIFAGADYLKWILKHFTHDIIEALAGYNAGVGRIKTGAWRRFSETLNYVDKIPQHAKAYKELRNLTDDKEKE